MVLLDTRTWVSYPLKGEILYFLLYTSNRYIVSHKYFLNKIINLTIILAIYGTFYYMILLISIKQQDFSNLAKFTELVATLKFHS